MSTGYIFWYILTKQTAYNILKVMIMIIDIEGGYSYLCQHI
jgi:uncharacterized membrane protein (DUF106 family)